MSLKKNILLFVIGSSLLGTFVSEFYIGRANRKHKGIENYEIVPFGISLLYGIFNILSYHSGIPFLFGGLQGLVFSIFGRFFMDNLPVKMFGFTNENAYLVHPLAFIFYGLIHVFILYPLTKYLIPDK